MSSPRPVSWTIRYRKENNTYVYGRTSNYQIAASCESKGWLVEAGNHYGDPTVWADILVARKEADADFDGGWEGDCTRGRECAWIDCCVHKKSADSI
jgi:hypothetical protein